jgi:hypothetical protein
MQQADLFVDAEQVCVTGYRLLVVVEEGLKTGRYVEHLGQVLQKQLAGASSR